MFGASFGTPQTKDPVSAGGLFGSMKMFGAPTTSSSPGTFGGQQPATTNLFGAQQTSLFGGGSSQPTSTTTTTGLFGQPQTGGLFGQPQQQQQQQPASGGLFGQQQQQSTTGGLFGQQQQSTTGGLFGQPQQSTTGGLFGQPQQPTTGLFGQPQQQQQPTTGGLFGQQQQPTTGGLFGQPQQSTTGGLFGQPQQSTTGGLFGQPTTTSGLFGQPQQQQQQQPTSGGLFGQPAQQQQRTGGLFDQFQPNQPRTGGLSSLFGQPQQQQQQQPGSQGFSSLFGVPSAFPTGLRSVPVSERVLLSQLPTVADMLKLSPEMEQALTSILSWLDKNDEQLAEVRALTQVLTTRTEKTLRALEWKSETSRLLSQRLDDVSAEVEAIRPQVAKTTASVRGVAVAFTSATGRPVHATAGEGEMAQHPAESSSAKTPRTVFGAPASASSFPVVVPLPEWRFVLEDWSSRYTRSSMRLRALHEAMDGVERDGILTKREKLSNVVLALNSQATTLAKLEQEVTAQHAKVQNLVQKRRQKPSMSRQFGFMTTG